MEACGGRKCVDRTRGVVTGLELGAGRGPAGLTEAHGDPGLEGPPGGSVGAEPLRGGCAAPKPRSSWHRGSWAAGWGAQAAEPTLPSAAAFMALA